MSGRGQIWSDVALPRKARAAHGDAWVQRLALACLVITLLYVVFGVPGEDTTDTGQTDRVSALNSWIWLALLLMSTPIALRRWREVAGLLLGCWPLLALFALFGLSVTWALDPSASFRRFLFTLVQLALFSTLLVGIRRAPLIHVAIAAVCTVAALADLASWVVAPGMAMTDEGFAGLQGQKNQTGLLLMYGILAAVPCMFLLRGRLSRLALAGGTVLMLALLVATRSTTSQSVVIAAALGMPVLLVVARLPVRVIWAIVAMAVLGLVMAAFGYLAWCAITRLDPWLPMRGVTFTARTDIWSFVVDEIAKRPWLGSGYSSFWGINPAVQPSLKTDMWFGVDVIITEAHSGYLDLWATNGIIGLVGGLLVLGRAIVLAFMAFARAGSVEQSWRDGRLARATATFYLALLLGLVIHNFTESNLFSNNGLLAVAFMLCLLDLEKWRITSRRELAWGSRA